MINATISDFTGFLQILVLDRPVVDKTGLQGRFDYQCTFTPDDSQFGGHPPPMPAQGNNTAQLTRLPPRLPASMTQFSNSLG